MSDTVKPLTAVDALLQYRQADADGVMVLASRQAIHEVIATITEQADCIAVLVEALEVCADHRTQPEVNKQYGHKMPEKTVSERHDLLIKVARKALSNLPALAKARREEVEALKAERDAVNQLLVPRYVSGDLVRMTQVAMDELKGLIETVCRLRGETDANADLKRFVHYVDHERMSPGGVSEIIDFAQGQMARAEAAEAQVAALKARAVTPGDAALLEFAATALDESEREHAAGRIRNIITRTATAQPGEVK